VFSFNCQTNKFASVELYDWMTGVLGEIYRFFLQQATSIAKLTETQLAFERQVQSPEFMQVNYWNAPIRNGSADSQTQDRRGLTGC
jgi:hypothetical protein